MCSIQNLPLTKLSEEIKRIEDEADVAGGRRWWIRNVVSNIVYTETKIYSKKNYLLS